jgi:peptidoglycan/xylan/chitin deacetylase (PgdA/CDA1 family)
MKCMRRLIKFASGFVLVFHEIPPGRFVDLVESIAPLEPVPLDTLVRRSKAGKRTAGLFAITVDDCLGENTKSLVKALQAKGWPATFYVPTAYVDSGHRMPFQWWSKLAPLLPHRVLHLRSEVLDLSRPGAVRRLSKRMEASWHANRLESYVPTIMELRDIVVRDRGISIESLNPQAVLGWQEITELSRNDLFRFESHGVSHSALSALSEPEVEFELKQSKDVLSEHTGRECRHFAYPFGNPRSIGSVSPKIAMRHYDSATTMSLGSVENAHPWLLPRIPLYPENSRRFAQLKILLKCTPLGLFGPYRNRWQEVG